MTKRIRGNRGWQLEQKCMTQPWIKNVFETAFPDVVAWKQVTDLEKQRDCQDVILVPRHREPFVVELKFRFVSEKIRSLRDLSIELWKDMGKIKGWPLKEAKETAYLMEIVKGPRSEPIEDEPKEIRVFKWDEFHAFVKGNFDGWMRDTSGRLDIRRDKDGYPRPNSTKVRYRIPLEKLKRGVPSMRVFQGVYPRCHLCGATDGLKPGNLFWSCKDVACCINDLVASYGQGERR